MRGMLEDWERWFEREDRRDVEDARAEVREVNVRSMRNMWKQRVIDTRGQRADCGC